MDQLVMLHCTPSVNWVLGESANYDLWFLKVHRCVGKRIVTLNYS